MRPMQKLLPASTSWRVLIICPVIQRVGSGKLRHARLKNSSDIYMV
nr:MAG TPA: hypothetical protein [Caudoviricetes sp.]